MPVLHGVSLSVARGEVVAIVGPSGSGKTTLLCILGCLLTPTSGQVVIDGQVLDLDRPEQLREIRRRSIGFVFQQFNLFPSLTASENVQYALNLKGWRGQKARIEAERVLEAVGLGDRKDFQPSRAFRRPAPAGRGGACNRRSARRDSCRRANRQPRLRKWNPRARAVPRLGSFRRPALLIVTHDPLVHTIADRIVTIRDGRLTQAEA